MQSIAKDIFFISIFNAENQIIYSYLDVLQNVNDGVKYT